MRADRRQRIARVGALRYDLEVGVLSQAQLESAARQRLIIDNDGGDLCAHACTVSSGTAMSIRRPGLEFNTAKRCCCP